MEDVPPSVSVVAAILVSDHAALPETMDAVRSQVYEPSDTFVVGGEGDGRRMAEQARMAWFGSIASLLSAADHASHVWFVRSGAIPDHRALDALVRESERADAVVAGSKLLVKDRPEELQSVGVATDVFDATYLGLERGEVDQGQYDVVRDVAAVSGVSLLIRRDLAQGIGAFDELMAAGASDIDLSQRARLRGARVVVVPSSSVRAPPEEQAWIGWREEAGRIRAMLKAYSALTLLWALPTLFLVGAVEAVVSPFLGRWTLFTWIQSWLWNVFRLPSTFRERVAVQRGKVAGDAELFRYQMRGSAKLRMLRDEVGSRLRARLGGDEGLAFAAIGKELRQPAIVAGFFALFFVAVVTRSIWSDQLPSVGYSLPLSGSGTAAIDAYAGGWNPAGLGSPEQLRPIIGLTGVVQSALFDKPGLTMAVLVVAAFVFGIWGTTRFLRTWGIDVVPGVAAGIVLMTGPAARALGNDARLDALLALGLLPWTLRLIFAPMSKRVWGAIGRVAAIGWVAGLMAAMSPGLIVVPVAAAAVWALVNVNKAGAWGALLQALAGAILAFPFLLPWLTEVDIKVFIETGSAFWEPGSGLAIAVGVALLAALLGAPRRLVPAVIWGGVMAAGGAWLARSAEFDLGVEVEVAGLAFVAIGTAAIVGTALESVAYTGGSTGPARPLGWIAAGAALVVIASSALIILPGRAGLPGDVVGDALDFTAFRVNEPQASRALLLGSADALPGDVRTIRGASYRVVSAPSPKYWESWLAEPLSGDRALENVLAGLIEGQTSRVGELLAPFGIRWVVVVGESPIEALLEGQLDLVPLGGLANRTFAVDRADAVIALAGNGDVWLPESGEYVGRAVSGERVRLAENADGRWGPDWTQVEWANSVSADVGAAEYRPNRKRQRLAYSAAGLLVLLILISWWGRRGR